MLLAPSPKQINSADELAQQVKLLLKDLGGSAKCCALAVSDPTGILRIIEQPNTPVELLRSALRLNGLAVLNQECKDFVLDCAPVSAVALAGVTPDGSGGAQLPAGQDPLPRRRNAASGGETDFGSDHQDEADRRHPATRAHLLVQCLRVRLPGNLRQRSLPPSRHGTRSKHGADWAEDGADACAQRRLWRQTFRRSVDRRRSS